MDEFDEFKAQAKREKWTPDYAVKQAFYWKQIADKAQAAERLLRQDNKALADVSDALVDALERAGALHLFTPESAAKYARARSEVLHETDGIREHGMDVYAEAKAAQKASKTNSGNARLKGKGWREAAISQWKDKGDAFKSLREFCHSIAEKDLLGADGRMVRAPRETQVYTVMLAVRSAGEI